MARYIDKNEREGRKEEEKKVVAQISGQSSFFLFFLSSLSGPEHQSISLSNFSQVHWPKKRREMMMLPGPKPQSLLTTPVVPVPLSFDIDSAPRLPVNRQGAKSRGGEGGRQAKKIT